LRGLKAAKAQKAHLQEKESEHAIPRGEGGETSLHSSSKAWAVDSWIHGVGGAQFEAHRHSEKKKKKIIARLSKKKKGKMRTNSEDTASKFRKQRL